MQMSINQNSLKQYIKKQLDFYIPDDYEIQDEILSVCTRIALERCENCFGHILLPHYRNEKGKALFSHLHMDQYATFLYFLGNTIWMKYENKELCDKILNLNRILNGFFLSYKCNMPDIFCLGHPIGSVIGNANYQDGLYISQNVTINTSKELMIGKGCYLGTGAKLIGKGIIGNKVSIGVDVTVYNLDIEDDKVCIKDRNGELVVRNRWKEKCMAERVFDIKF